MIAMALFGMLTYSGSEPGAAIGYLLAVLAASVFAPAAGALTNELFPTSVRASVIGWEIAAGVFGATVGLLTFGAVADVGNRFGLAAVVVFAAAIPATALFALLPETATKSPRTSGRRETDHGMPEARLPATLSRAPPGTRHTQPSVCRLLSARIRASPARSSQRPGRVDLRGDRERREGYAPRSANHA